MRKIEALNIEGTINNYSEYDFISRHCIWATFRQIMYGITFALLYNNYNYRLQLIIQKTVHSSTQ